MGKIEKIFDKEDSLLDVFRHFVFHGSLTTNYTLGRFEDELKELEADRKRLEKIRKTVVKVLDAGKQKRNEIKRNLAGTDVKTTKIDIMIDTWQDMLDLIDEPMKEAG